MTTGAYYLADPWANAFGNFNDAIQAEQTAAQQERALANEEANRTHAVEFNTTDPNISEDLAPYAKDDDGNYLDLAGSFARYASLNDWKNKYGISTYADLLGSDNEDAWKEFVTASPYTYLKMAKDDEGNYTRFLPDPNGTTFNTWEDYWNYYTGADSIGENGSIVNQIDTATDKMLDLLNTEGNLDKYLREVNIDPLIAEIVHRAGSDASSIMSYYDMLMANEAMAGTALPYLLSQQSNDDKGMSAFDRTGINQETLSNLFDTSSEERDRINRESLLLNSMAALGTRFGDSNKYAPNTKLISDIIELGVLDPEKGGLFATTNGYDGYTAADYIKQNGKNLEERNNTVTQDSNGKPVYTPSKEDKFDSTYKPTSADVRFTKVSDDNLYAGRDLTNKLLYYAYKDNLKFIPPSLVDEFIKSQTQLKTDTTPQQQVKNADTSNPAYNYIENTQKKIDLEEGK